MCAFLRCIGIECYSVRPDHDAIVIARRAGAPVRRCRRRVEERRENKGDPPRCRQFCLQGSQCPKRLQRPVRHLRAPEKNASVGNGRSPSLWVGYNAHTCRAENTFFCICVHVWLGKIGRAARTDGREKEKGPFVCQQAFSRAHTHTRSFVRSRSITPGEGAKTRRSKERET